MKLKLHTHLDKNCFYFYHVSKYYIYTIRKISFWDIINKRKCQCILIACLPGWLWNINIVNNVANSVEMKVFHKQCITLMFKTKICKIVKQLIKSFTKQWKPVVLSPNDHRWSTHFFHFSEMLMMMLIFFGL